MRHGPRGRSPWDFEAPDPGDELVELLTDQLSWALAPCRSPYELQAYRTRVLRG